MRILLLFILTILLSSSLVAQVQFSTGAMPYYYQAELVLPERGYHTMGEYNLESSISVAGFIQMHLGGFAIRVEGTSVNYNFFAPRVNIPPVSDPEKYSETTFEYNIFEIPIMGIYRFGVKKFQPFIGAGFNIGLNTNTEFSEKVFNFEDFRGDIDYNPVDYDWDKTTLGLIATAGGLYRVNSNLYLFLDLRYVINESGAFVFRTLTSSGGYGIGSTNLKTNRYQIGTGVEYKF